MSPYYRQARTASPPGGRPSRLPGLPVDRASHAGGRFGGKAGLKENFRESDDRVRGAVGQVSQVDSVPLVTLALGRGGSDVGP